MQTNNFIQFDSKNQQPYRLFGYQLLNFVLREIFLILLVVGNSY